MEVTAIFKSEKHDPEGFYRVVEGPDTTYSFIALSREKHGGDYGVNLVIKFPYTKQMMSKLLSPRQARILASELNRFADEVEVYNETVKS